MAWCWLSPASSRTCSTLRHSGLADRIGANRIFPTLPTAVAAFKAEH